MDFIVKLLFLSGKYLTRAAGRTIIEIISRGVTISRSITFKYEKAVQVVTPYNSMLELLNTHTQDVDEIENTSVPDEFSLISNNLPVIALPRTNTERILFDNSKFASLMKTTLHNTENEFYLKNCSKSANFVSTTTETTCDIDDNKSTLNFENSNREKNARISKSATLIECEIALPQNCPENTRKFLLRSNSCIGFSSPPYFVIYNGLNQLASSNLYYKGKFGEKQKYLNRKNSAKDNIKYGQDLLKNTKLNACSYINSALLLQDSHFSKSESNLNRKIKPIDSKRKLSSTTSDSFREAMSNHLEREMKFVRVSQRAFHNTERTLTRILIKQTMQDEENKTKSTKAKRREQDIAHRKKLMEVNQKAFKDFESDINTVVLLDKNKVMEHKFKSDTFKYEFINSFKHSLNAAALTDSIKDRILTVLNKKDGKHRPKKDSTLSSIFKHEVQDIRNRLLKQVSWLKLHKAKPKPVEGDVRERGNLLQTNDTGETFSEKLPSANDTLQKLLEATQQEYTGILDAEKSHANWFNPPTENKCNFGFSRQYHFRSNKILNCHNTCSEGKAINCNNRVDVITNPSLNDKGNVDIIMICANVKNATNSDFAAVTRNESDIKDIGRPAIQSEAVENEEISDILRKVKYLYEDSFYEESTSKEEEEITKCVAKEIDSIRPMKLTKDGAQNSLYSEKPLGTAALESQKNYGNLQVKSKDVSITSTPKQKNKTHEDNDDEIENGRTQSPVKHNLVVSKTKSTPRMVQFEQGKKGGKLNIDKISPTKLVEVNRQKPLDFKKFSYKKPAALTYQSLLDKQKNSENLQVKNKSINVTSTTLKKEDDNMHSNNNEKIKHNLAMSQVKSIPKSVQFGRISYKQNRKGGKFEIDNAKPTKPVEDDSQNILASAKSEALTYQSLENQKKYNNLQVKNKCAPNNEKIEKEHTRTYLECSSSEAKPVKIVAKSFKQNQKEGKFKIGNKMEANKMEFKINDDDNRGKPHLLRKKFAFKPLGEANRDEELTNPVALNAIKNNVGLHSDEVEEKKDYCKMKDCEKSEDIRDNKHLESKADANGEEVQSPTDKLRPSLNKPLCKSNLKNNELADKVNENENNIDSSNLLQNGNKLVKFGDMISEGEFKNYKIASRGSKQEESEVEANSEKPSIEQEENNRDGVQRKICWTSPDTQNTDDVNKSKNKNYFSLREIAYLIKRVLTKRIGPKCDENESKTSSDLIVNNESEEATNTNDGKIKEEHKILAEKIDDIINEYCNTCAEEKTREPPDNNKSSKKYCKTILARCNNAVPTTNDDVKSSKNDSLTKTCKPESPGLNKVSNNQGKDVVKPDTTLEMEVPESQSEPPKTAGDTERMTEEARTILLRSAIAKSNSISSHLSGPKTQEEIKLIKSDKLNSACTKSNFFANKPSTPNPLDTRVTFDRNENVPHSGRYLKNKIVANQDELYPKTLRRNKPYSFGPTTTSKKRANKFVSDESNESHTYKKVNTIPNKFSFKVVTDNEMLTPLAAIGNDETESQYESSFSSATGNLSSDSSYDTANTHVPPSSSDETGGLVYMRRKKNTTQLINELYKRSMRYAVKRNDRLWLAEQQMKESQRRKNLFNSESPNETMDNQQSTKQKIRATGGSIYERFPFLNKHKKIASKPQVNILNKELIDNIRKSGRSQFRNYKEHAGIKLFKNPKSKVSVHLNTSSQQKYEELLNNKDQSAKQKSTELLNDKIQNTKQLEKCKQETQGLTENADDICKRFPFLKKTTRFNRVKHKTINQDQITERLLNLNRKYSNITSRQINKSAIPNELPKQACTDQAINKYKYEPKQQQKNENIPPRYNARCSGLKQCYTPQSHALNVTRPSTK